MVKFSDRRLYYNRDESLRLVLYSQEERRRVLKECHNDDGGAHQGIVRTQSKIKALYYWMSGATRLSPPPFFITDYDREYDAD